MTQKGMHSSALTYDFEAEISLLDTTTGTRHVIPVTTAEINACRNLGGFMSLYVNKTTFTIPAAYPPAVTTDIEIKVPTSVIPAPGFVGFCRVDEVTVGSYLSGVIFNTVGTDTYMTIKKAAVLATDVDPVGTYSLTPGKDVDIYGFSLHFKLP